jgi:hypothetical protein
MMAALALFLAFPSLQAMDMPDTITLDDGQGKVDHQAYTPVTMPHQKHESFDCKACHHKWEEKDVAPQKCTASGCHDLIGAEGGKMRRVEAAFAAHHDYRSTKSCLGCHAEHIKAGDKAGPVLCTKCHPREAR